MKPTGAAALQRSRLWRYVRITLLATIAVLAIGVVPLFVGGGHFQSPTRLWLYAIAPMLIGIVAIALCFASASCQTQAVAYFGAAGLALIAAELVVQERGFKASQAPRLEAPAGEPAMQQICPSHIISGQLERSHFVLDGVPFVPLGGMSNVILGHKGEARSTPHRSDRFGFNNPDDAWRPGPDTLVFVGDSFTWGADSPLAGGFVDLIRADTGLPVVNLGCGGNGPLAELAALIEYGATMKPGIVVWVYHEGNDLTKDLDREWRVPELRAYLTIGHERRLRERQDEIDAMFRAAYAAADRARQVRPRPARKTASWRQTATLHALRTSLGLVYGFPNEALDRFTDVLRRARDVVSGWGGELVFVYLPGEARVRTVLARSDADAYKRAVLARAHLLGLPTVDLAAVFVTYPQPALLYAGHFSELGNRLTADTLLRSPAISSRRQPAQAEPPAR